MLLIWDIHISSHLGDKILLTIKNYVASHPDEQDIVFLGDYVYHFSYDRNALLALYNYFVELFEQGKNVYVLAGNHDRLGQHFVYAEAKTAFDLLKSVDTKNLWKLHFITEPELHTIQWEKFLFFPFMLDPDKSRNPSLSKRGEKGDALYIDEQKRQDINTQNNSIKIQIQELSQSQDKHEQHSAKINKILLNFLDTEDKITVIHHYYINKIKFPGQKARFSFKDISLSEYFLENKNIKMISGHLHQPFSWKNYFCLGSVRSTSSLESNQLKILARYDIKKQKLFLEQTQINPYFLIEQKQETSDLFGEKKYIYLDKIALENFIQEVSVKSQKNFADKSSRQTELISRKLENLSNATINLRVDDLDYDKIDDFISPDLREQIKECRLKKNQANMSDILQDFELASKNLSESFADRKNLLKTHLKRKFGDDAEKYEKVLREEKLI